MTAVSAKCAWCKGSGRERDVDTYCPACVGNGKVVIDSPAIRCDSCSGKGEERDGYTRCRKCNGTGWKMVENERREEGQKIRLVGKRHLKGYGTFDYYSGRPSICPKCNVRTSSNSDRLDSAYEQLGTRPGKKDDYYRVTTMNLIECNACGHKYLENAGTGNRWGFDTSGILAEPV